MAVVEIPRLFMVEEAPDVDTPYRVSQQVDTFATWTVELLGVAARLTCSTCGHPVIIDADDAAAYLLVMTMHLPAVCDVYRRESRLLD